MKTTLVEEQLNEWLDYVLHDVTSDPPANSLYFQFCLPSVELESLYLARVATEDEKDVRVVLRHLLLPSCSLGVDGSRLRFLLNGRRRGLPGEADCEQYKGLLRGRLFELDRRLLAHARDSDNPPPWEGVTWVLDLLPEFPQEALDGLSAYLLAHAQALPDGRLAGMSNALAIIRARYIGLPGVDVSDRLDALLALPSRTFEHLVERYFAAEGYDTLLTPERKDGGRDILASKEDPAPSQTLLVECKNWRKRVGVPQVRQLLGSVSDEKATHGILVATSGFTHPARNFGANNPRIGLVDGEKLVRDFNRRLGTNWPAKIDRLVLRSQTKAV